MLTIVLILSLLSVAFGMLSRSRAYVQAYAQLFFAVQIATAVWALMHRGETELGFFTFDALGVTYYALMAVMGLICCLQSARYLDKENLRETKIYLFSLIALNVTLTGVYFANNITVTWIFLEATTIATAGLTYHRRTLRSLEATWKYIFVSSVGIAIAYLGILLLSTVSFHGTPEQNGDLSYPALTALLQSGAGNPLYIKLAFVFLLVGYSSKFELFPLYTVGVDANHSAPTPVSAFISSALVGGGFVAIFRVYKVMQGSAEIIGWVQHVMLLVGLLSLVVAAVYMGRTRNLKRLAAYSTVENSGLIAIGLGIGGIGVWAAVLHSLAHTLIKGAMMLQLSVVGKIYGGYKTSRIGEYFRVDPLGGLVIALSVVALAALPPSVLFRTEYLMFTTLIEQGLWWVVLLAALPLLVAIYWLCSKLLPMLYKPTDISRICPERKNTLLSSVLLLLIAATFVAGIWQAPFLIDLVNAIVS